MWEFHLIRYFSLLFFLFFYGRISNQFVNEIIIILKLKLKNKERKKERKKWVSIIDQLTSLRIEIALAKYLDDRY